MGHLYRLFGLFQHQYNLTTNKWGKWLILSMALGFKLTTSHTLVSSENH